MDRKCRKVVWFYMQFSGYIESLLYDADFSVLGTSEILLSYIFLDSSMVEHPAVNRRVVGSSPTRGASLRLGEANTKCEAEP